MIPNGKNPVPPEHFDGEISRSVSLFDRVAMALADHPQPDFAEGVLCMMALTALGIIATSPEDEAERLQAIATMARRNYP